MPELVPCEYCTGPTEFITNIQPLGNDPGHRIYFCEACKRHTWTKWWATQQQQQQQPPQPHKED